MAVVDLAPVDSWEDIQSSEEFSFGWKLTH